MATTRPETLLGDSAVAVHPDDERYAHLIGKTIVLPISGREVPIVADDYVEKILVQGASKSRQPMTLTTMSLVNATNYRSLIFLMKMRA